MIFGKFRKAKNSDINLAEINENTELAVFSEVDNDVKPKEKTLKRKNKKEYQWRNINFSCAYNDTNVHICRNDR